MSNEDNNLKLESDFQDSKVTDGVRAETEKYYQDEATKEAKAFVDELIGDVNGKHVLDIGCGTGASSIDALKRGAFVTAIDISPESINLVKELAKEIGLENNLNAVVMDAQNMTFEDGSFDIVFGNGVLHHLPDFEQSIKEIRRVLKTDGYAVFLEPMGINPFLNLFRFLTPSKRTKGEQPFKTVHLNIIKKIFPNTEFHFYENAVLFTKVFIGLHMNKLADKMQDKLMKVDNKHLRKDNGITLYKKMAWIVVLKMK